MDELVKQAMAKWPNVPHCYGWLALDARGHWRMRDERAQRLGLPGDKIAHVALLAFIVRNYTHDADGCWYFQNGPQRVYLNLEATPYIVRTNNAQQFVLHTGGVMGAIEQAWLTDLGELILQSGETIAQLDDRDGAALFEMLAFDGKPVDDNALMAWLQDGGCALTLRHGEGDTAVQHLRHELAAQHLGFLRTPVAPAT